MIFFQDFKRTFWRSWNLDVDFFWFGLFSKIGWIPSYGGQTWKDSDHPPSYRLSSTLPKVPRFIHWVLILKPSLVSIISSYLLGAWFWQDFKRSLPLFSFLQKNMYGSFPDHPMGRPHPTQCAFSNSFSKGLASWGWRTHSYLKFGFSSFLYFFDFSSLVRSLGLHRPYYLYKLGFLLLRPTSLPCLHGLDFLVTFWTSTLSIYIYIYILVTFWTSTLSKIYIILYVIVKKIWGEALMFAVRL